MPPKPRLEHVAASWLQHCVLQALANQQAMVRLLVESGRVPIDAPIGPSGVTALMAVAGRRCTLHPKLLRVGLDTGQDAGSLPVKQIAHCCGRADEMAWVHAKLMRGTTGRPVPDACVPMTGMLRLLLELGADAAATDADGRCMLAHAAFSGQNSAWDLIMREPDLAQRCSPHAGQVLTAAVLRLSFDARAPLVESILSAASVAPSPYLEDDRVGRFRGVLGYLQRSFAARGQQQLFTEQMAAPIHTTLSTGGGMLVSALWMAMQGSGRPGSDAERNPAAAARELLAAGCSLDALRLGRGYYVLDSNCTIEKLIIAIKHAKERGEVQQQGDVLIGLLCACTMFDEDEQHPQPQHLAAAARALHKMGLDMRQERWWPSRFGPALVEHCPAAFRPGIAVAPWHLACALANPQAAAGMLLALQQLDGGEKRWVQEWIDAPVGPAQDVTLVLAVRSGDAAAARQLLAAGAHPLPRDGAGRNPLFAALEVRCSLHAAIVSLLGKPPTFKMIPASQAAGLHGQRGMTPSCYDLE
jgi:hypothetical protein